jgi:hypothetical protein
MAETIVTIKRHFGPYGRRTVDELRDFLHEVEKMAIILGDEYMPAAVVAEKCALLAHFSPREK